MIKFSIAITTKNRYKDLKLTLQSIEQLILRSDVELLVCDDGSTDGTQEFLKHFYSNTRLYFNSKSKGLIYNRNILNNEAKGEFIISLDDDAQFLTSNPLELIEACFNMHPKCGVQSFRIYWSKTQPKIIVENEKEQLSKSFVGCGHVWRKLAWDSIPNYPDWFVFYGEEDFAAFQLFKAKWDIVYNPKVFIHHRVEVQSRKKQNDYRLRLRRSLRSGWYLYFMFYPLKAIPKRFIYTLWVQMKTKVFKGDLKAFIAIIQALFDLIWNSLNIYKNTNRLTVEAFDVFNKLPDTKIYCNTK